VTTIVSKNGEVALPADLLARDGIAPGQRFEIERQEEGRYLLKRQPEADNEGLVDWLLACPEKGWFQPIDSESTDTL
jgi:bifunctional DNA-binding transcriptional regulator/antitoxin component of YhaV-PrlF toxin-antitoxin module